MDGRRASRDEWRRRVDRWKESGLTAKEFAAEIGINAGTLQFWRYKLKKVQPKMDGERAAHAASSILSSIVEVRPSAAAADGRFEIELAKGRRVRVPAGFDPSALKVLLAIVDGTT